MDARIDDETTPVDVHDYASRFRSVAHDLRDPDPWLALFLDRSLPIDEQVKAALVLDAQSYSRQFLLPIIRPLARLAIIFIQLLKTIVPRAFTSSRVLHKLISWGLRNWVTPQANFLIVRHFHIGSEILKFIATNVPYELHGLTPLKPRNIKDLEDDVFLKHDLNLYNFIILLNQQMQAAGASLHAPANVDFSAVTSGPFPIESFPNRWSNFLDLSSAIEIYTPLYQLFLTDRDFWRASNSLQLDETIAIYVATLLGDATHLSLVNNKHPLVPLSTLRAGSRLVIHGLAAECLHGILVQHKLSTASGSSTALGLRTLWGLHG